MSEIWKPIVGYEDYEISSHGRVKNLNTNKILKNLIRKDYYYVDLYDKEHKPTHKPIHRLVAEAFIGSPEKDYVVNHIDGNKLNNWYLNLEYVTPKENSSLASINGLYKSKAIKILETDEVFKSIKDCADTLNVHPSDISHVLSGKRSHCKGLHFELIDAIKNDENKFLRDYQFDAVKKLHDGCILNGGVGSGKSRTGLYYYFSQYGGHMNPYKKMVNPSNLYIITTAKKRDDKEWEDELVPFLLSPDQKLNYYNNKVIVDSWNNIKKYINIKNAFFIFDEDHVTGTGSWVKSFYKITKNNRWIILSATAGDTWNEYGPVFVANGFYRNITEFRQEHVTYKPYSNFPQIDHQRYRNVGRLVRLRRKILIPMDFERHTVRHDEYIMCDYDSITYKQICKTRTNPFNAMYPIQNASEFCQALRRVVNSADSRKLAVLEIMDKKPKAIIFYNYDYELEGLIELCDNSGIDYAQWNGHKHEEIPKGDKWMYLVQYNAGSEGWNYVGTDIIIFYSLNYSYKMTEQASGRIDRLNTPFTDLYYYHLMSRSGIDMAILKALKGKKKFNEGSYCRGMDFDTATGKVPFAS